MTLIDSHCHLTFDNFKSDLEAVLARAREAGVVKILVPGIDLKTSIAAVELAGRYPEIYAAVGVHPQDAASFQEATMKDFQSLCRHPKVVAVGEIGLDYYRDYGPRETQRAVFQRFLELAEEEDLPVIVHNRAAFADTVNILSDDRFQKVTGVFHCFSEGEAEAQQVLKMGFKVSFTGTITFKNSRSARLAATLPLSEQLVETDAPFMAPVPFRGKRNEPSFVREIALKQAELHGVPLETAAEVTTRTTEQLFPGLSKHEQGI